MKIGRESWIVVAYGVVCIRKSAETPVGIRDAKRIGDDREILRGGNCIQIARLLAEIRIESPTDGVRGGLIIIGERVAVIIRELWLTGTAGGDALGADDALDRFFQVLTDFSAVSACIDEEFSRVGNDI